MYSCFRTNTRYRAQVRHVGTRLGQPTELSYRARIQPEDAVHWQLEEDVGFRELIGAFTNCAPEKFAASVRFKIVPRQLDLDLDGHEWVNGTHWRPVSSDRAIREYCRDIWHVEPVRIRLPDPE